MTSVERPMPATPSSVPDADRTPPPRCPAQTGPGGGSSSGVSQQPRTDVTWPLDVPAFVLFLSIGPSDQLVPRRNVPVYRLSFSILLASNVYCSHHPEINRWRGRAESIILYYG
jgi:hypothetical protein